MKAGSLVGSEHDHVINFEDHFDHLSGQEQLLLLADKCFENELRLHVISSLPKGV